MGKECIRAFPRPQKPKCPWVKRSISALRPTHVQAQDCSLQPHPLAALPGWGEGLRPIGAEQLPGPRCSLWLRLSCQVFCPPWYVLMGEVSLRRHRKEIESACWFWVEPSVGPSHQLSCSPNTAWRRPSHLEGGCACPVPPLAELRDRESGD